MFHRDLGEILHDELHWLDVPDRVFFKLARDSSPVSERPRSTVPVGLYCVPAAIADTRRQLRSSNRQLAAVPRYRISNMPAPQSGTLSRILSGTRSSVQTVSDVCLRRTCLLDTSALNALEVLDDYCAI